MNFLFWNINGKKLKEHIFNLSKKYDLDIIILAENKINKTELLLELNKESPDYFIQHPNSLCDKIHIFTRFSYDFIEPVYEHNRYTVRKLTLPEKKQILITALHFIDKSNHDAESQYEEAKIFADNIKAIEKQENIFENIFVGDFNMNPFEKGMVMSTGFNSTMSRRIASKSHRTVQGNPFKYLYNPMWSLYGDIYSEPVGSYHYPQSQHISYEWNLFDQVLLRPELIDFFDTKALEIVIDDGTNLLVNPNGIPNASDHLPVFFKLNI